MRALTVPKNQLLLIAGVLWSLAGAMVLRVGLPLEVRLAPGLPVLVPLAIGVFIVFYVFVFLRLLRKHTLRIQASHAERLPIWRVFNASSWVIMGVMVTVGMILRVSHALPDWAVAFFYTGLGTALLLCGLRFFVTYLRPDTVAHAGETVPVEA